MRESDMASTRHGAAPRDIHRLFVDGTLAGLSDARLLERYIADRDELAFQALVQRHGPMVLAVCRGVLDDPNDADDAFQAAFLLLARKAKSIWIDDSVGGWLHRVAWRIALQVNSDAARHRRQEHKAAELARARERANLPWDDTGAVLHQEIERLPERYRKPVVLCYLEGMTCQQAASYLRLSEGTTRGRLARGKALLRDRLKRRGVAFVAATMGSGAAARTASAASMALTQATVRAAVHIALGNTAAVGTGSTTTIALMRQTMRAMMITRLKMAAAGAMIVGALTCVATGLAAMGPTTPDETVPASPRFDRLDPAAGTAKADHETEVLAFHGRVLGPDGKPAGGVVLYTVDAGSIREPAQPVLRTNAEVDGTFCFTMPKAELGDAVGRGPRATLTLLATAEGFGPDWVELTKPADEELTLRLVDDSVPIQGRVLDLQGRPVAHAKITRGRIRAEGADGIDPYLKLLRDDPRRASNHRFAKNYGSRLPGEPATVTTDIEGRFGLTGIGRDRIVEIEVEGPTIQNATITAMTRKAATVSTPPGTFAAKTIYGASFDHLIPPGRALTGVVRDKRTKQPLVGVAVVGKKTNAHAITDAEGRYTLPGFPKDKSYALIVLAGQKAPYFVTCLSVPDTAGMAPIQADVECVRGIPMRLKLIDKTSDTVKPVTGADVFYEPVYPNSHFRDVPGYAPVQGHGRYNSGIAQSDGTYLLGVLPGPGAVFVRTAEGKYRPACVDPQAFFQAVVVSKPGERSNQIYGDRNTIFVAARGGKGASLQDLYNAIILVNPPDDSGPLAVEAGLQPDRKHEVHVLGPDGRPVAGVTGHNHWGLIGYEGIEATKKPGVMAISRLNPMRPKRFTFRHDGKKLVGSLIARGDEAEPSTVRLQPWGTIAGRLVDAQGKPRPGVGLLTPDWQESMANPAFGLLPAGLKTDAEGRFHVEGLVPGQEYSGDAVGVEAVEGGFGVVIDRVVLKPDETRDLGDVRSREIERENKR
jgi:RNA polymerase sigma factor (sigma-70 family)